jgi:predicted HTH domain antitoxin
MSNFRSRHVLLHLAALVLGALSLQSPGRAQTAEPLAAANTQTADRLKSWSDAQDQVDQLLRKREASDYADDWKMLHEDGGWFGKTTAERADAVIDVLATGKLRDIRNRLQAIRADIQSHRDKIRDLHFAEVGQLDDASRDKTARLIEAENQAIQKDDAQVNELAAAFSAELRDAGVDLSPAQLGSLLNVTSGDDLSEIAELFASLRTISDALEQSTVSSSEDIDIAKRYYEIYAVLLDTALYAEVRFIHKVDELWIPRIDAVTVETRKLGAETDRLLATTSNANRSVLAANKRAQGMTLQTADLYRHYLLEQRRVALNAARKLLEQRNVALNTYKTVAQSIDLVRLVRTSNGEFQQLLQVEIPPLRPFESEQMKQEFEKLSNQINKPAS